MSENFGVKRERRFAREPHLRPDDDFPVADQIRQLFHAKVLADRLALAAKQRLVSEKPAGPLAGFAKKNVQPIEPAKNAFHPPYDRNMKS